jgi:hypothetical protein
MSAYVIALFTHSYLRWLVLTSALWLLARSGHGWARKRSWSRLDERSHQLLVALVDLQVTLGLCLYLFLSPYSRAIFGDSDAAMHNPVLRFFGMEHALGMSLGIVLIHLGRDHSQRAASSTSRQRRVCASTLGFLLIVGVSIPWPFLPYGRPLLRGITDVADASPRARPPCPATTKPHRQAQPATQALRCTNHRPTRPPC